MVIELATNELKVPQDSLLTSLWIQHVPCIDRLIDWC